MLTLKEFKEARGVLSGVIRNTSLVYSPAFSKATGNQIYIKPENMQVTGAYKIRGAYYKISTLSDEEKARGLVTASAGNHAQGVAYAAKVAGVKATVVMPTTTPLMKVNRTKQYGDQVRTFCMNPYGHVVAENVEGINTVNGHSYADPSLRSENTNFALLVSNRFTQPFNEPYRYGKHIASLSNMLAGGVLVQRFGDLVKGVRTNEHRLGKSFTRPTLTAAVPGDLSLALPKRQLDDIIEMIYQLDKLAPGTANYDTLLYGAEVKFYSARLALSPELETALPGFFAAGDGAGVTRGLAQAGASGVQAARAVLRRIQEEV